jgi:ATP-dependent DNA helicase RecQ
MSTKNKNVLSVETMCRFLTGLTVPLVSRNKVKQLSGFGSCENIRYKEVREKVIGIMNK